MDLSRAFREIVDNINCFIMIMDDCMNIVYANPAALKLPGWNIRSLKAAPGEALFKFVLPDIDIQELRMAAYNNQKPFIFKTGSKLLRKAGDHSNVNITVLPIYSKNVLKFIGVLTQEQVQNKAAAIDKTTSFQSDKKTVGLQNSNSMEHLRYLSFHDGLTGLYNRAYFEEELLRLDRGRRFPYSIILGDLNCLKLVNDVFGHMEGDRFLCAMSKVLKSSCRKEDIVVRWGGDEFAIILPVAGEKTAEQICRRIKKFCQADWNTPVKLSIALGTATKNDKQQEVSQLFKDAEDRMYHEKFSESHIMRNAVIESLRYTLLQRGIETKEQTELLKSLSHILGEAAGLRENDLERLELLSELHDIGAITIPDTILFKTEKLLGNEMEIIKKHPETGYRIAGFSPEFYVVADAILTHHERYDGTGYPQGLSGDKIPYISRIFSVVDAYTAMLSPRAFRKAFAYEEVLVELEKNSGSQFDPEIIKLLINLSKDL